MAIVKMSLEKVCKSIENSIMDELKAKLKKRLYEVAKDEVEKVIDDIAREIFLQMVGYEDFHSDKVKLILNIDGIHKEFSKDKYAESQNPYQDNASDVKT